MSPTSFRLFCSQSFQKNTSVSSQVSYVDVAKDQETKQRTTTITVYYTILMEFRKAVWALSKDHQRDMIERIRHRRWLIDQAKKWGIKPGVIHENLRRYGGNFWNPA